MDPTVGPSYKLLQQENLRLRAQLAELREQRPAGLTTDFAANRVSIRNLKTPELAIDSLDVHVPQLGSLAADLLKVSSLVNSSKSVQLPSLKGFEKTPLEVESAHLRLPEKTINQIVGQMRPAGVSNLNLTLGEQGKVKLTGSKDGLLSIPFEVQGTVSRENDEQVRFSLEKTRVLGFLPVPRLMTDIFASLASHTMSQLHVEKKGDDFLLNAGAFLPSNIDMGLKAVTTQDGYLIVEAGQRTKRS